jgi:hypothetical protein
MTLVSVWRSKTVAEVKGALGFHKSHHYIPAWAIGVGTVHSTSPEIIE